MTQQTRRDFLSTTGLAAVSLASPLQWRWPWTKPAQSRHLLLRNGWDVSNIGDVAHVPGAIALLRRFIPEAAVTVWANSDLVIRNTSAAAGHLPDGVVDLSKMSLSIDPTLQFVTGRLDEAGTASNGPLDQAVAQADAMVVGSGATINDPTALIAFKNRTGRPVGAFGITIDPFFFNDFNLGAASVSASALRLCSFIYTRETASLAVITGADVDGDAGTQTEDETTPVTEKIDRPRIDDRFPNAARGFVPDTTFAFERSDDDWARTFMDAHGLVEQRFAVFVPRLRYTPVPRPTAAGDDRTQYNEIYAEADHAKLRTAICRYVRDTGGRVVLGPEAAHQVDLLGPLLQDRLPDDVRPSVIKLDRYWLPDQARSVFAKASIVVSLENHSPIIAASAGTPFLMVHQAEDTLKSVMFEDIGLGSWLIDHIDNRSGEEIADRMMSILSDRAGSLRNLSKAMRYVRNRHRDGMIDLRGRLRLSEFPPQEQTRPIGLLPLSGDRRVTRRGVFAESIVSVPAAIEPTTPSEARYADQDSGLPQPYRQVARPAVDGQSLSVMLSGFQPDAAYELRLHAYDATAPGRSVFEILTAEGCERLGLIDWEEAPRDAASYAVRAVVRTSSEGKVRLAVSGPRAALCSIAITGMAEAGDDVPIGI